MALTYGELIHSDEDEMNFIDDLDVDIGIVADFWKSRLLRVYL